MSSNNPITHDYEERIRALVADGYCLRYDYRSPTLAMARLKHMANGNHVILKADYNCRKLTQHTNNVLRYSHNYA